MKAKAALCFALSSIALIWLTTLAADGGEISVKADSAGNVYVADTANQTIPGSEPLSHASTPQPDFSTLSRYEK